jgi:hypothetical protein
VKVRVLNPTFLAASGGPAYAEGMIEVEAEVAKVAEEVGAVERVGRGKAQAAKDKPTAKKKRRKKTTATTGGGGPLTKADVPGA